jgi:hypothetical protein
LFKFEKYFETIIKNNKNCKENLKMHNSRKSRREVNTNEHVGLILIFDSKEDWE